MTAVETMLSEFIVADIAALLAVGLVLVLRGPVRRLAGARIAYALWLVVPAAVLATLLPAQTLPAVLPQAQAAGAALVEQAARGWPWAPAALTLWIAGAITSLLVLVIRQHVAVRALGKLTPAGRNIRRAGRGGVGPVVIGVLFPRIVLPAGFEETFDEAERRLVLAHEQAHVEGRHVLVKTAAQVFVCLNWFNPLAYLASAAISRDQEFACDETVAQRFPSDRRVYAMALVKAQIGGRLPLGCAWPPGSKQLLRARIAMLAARAPGRMRRGAGVAVIAFATLAAGYAAWAEQPAAPQKTAGATASAADWTHCEISAESAEELKKNTRVLLDLVFFKVTYHEIAGFKWTCDDGSVDTQRPPFSIGSETSYSRPPAAPKS